MRLLVLLKVTALLVPLVDEHGIKTAVELAPGV
jgi:hypothetical protein